MAQAYTFVQALQAAGKDLTREGIVDALEEDGASTSRARCWRRSATASDSHMGISGLRVVELQDGRRRAADRRCWSPTSATPRSPRTTPTQANDAPPESGIPE